MHSVCLFLFRMLPFPNRIKQSKKGLKEEILKFQTFIVVFATLTLMLTSMRSGNGYEQIVHSTVDDVDDDVHHYLNRLVFDWKWNRWPLSYMDQSDTIHKTS